MLVSGTATGLVLIIVAVGALGRMIKTYTYKELKEMSDAIVIAEAIRTTNTDEPHIKWKFMRGVTTRFRILSTIKGEITGNEIDVLHWRYVEPDIYDAPTVVRFTGHELHINVKRDKEHAYSTTVKPKYFLYLKRSGGRFCLSDSDQAHNAVACS